MDSETEQAFLEHFSPPFARLNQQDEVIYASKNLHRYLQRAKGVTSETLDNLLIECLRAPVRQVLKKVRKSRDFGEVANVVVDINNSTEVFDLRAKALDEDVKSILIAFQPVRLTNSAQQIVFSKERILANETDPADEQNEPAAIEKDFRKIERSLLAQNDDLFLMNEKLRITNMDLEITQEDLVSTNEEIESFNSQLIDINEQLKVSNSHLKNLFSSTDIAILFVDQNSLVQFFTPRSKELFCIQERHIGRSIFDVTSFLNYPDFRDDLQKSSRQFLSFSREIKTQDDSKDFLVKLQPYQDVDDALSGSFVSFIDITDQCKQKRELDTAKSELNARIAELEAIFECSPIGVGLLGPDNRYARVNQALAEIVGLSIEEILGHRPQDIVPYIWEIVEPIHKRVSESGKPELGIEVTAPVIDQNADPRTWVANYFPVMSEAEEMLGIGLTTMEITSVKRLERALEAQKANLRKAGANILKNFEHAPVSIMIHHGTDHLLVHANKMARDCFGEDDITALTLNELLPNDFIALKPVYDAVYNSGKARIDNEVIVNTRVLNGKIVAGVFRRIIQPYYGPNGDVEGVICLSLDVSQLVAMRDEHLRQTVRLESMFDTMDAKVLLVDRQDNIINSNASAASHIGSDPVQFSSKNLYIVLGAELLPADFKRLKDAVNVARNGEVSEFFARTQANENNRVSHYVISVKPVISAGNYPKSSEVIIVMNDHTKLLEANRRKDVLVAELEHRVKNILTTLQAVARFTAAGAPDVDALVNELDDRIAAMSRAHEKLTTSGWVDQRLEDIIQNEANVYQADQANRVIYQGDQISLPASASMLVCLAAHELLKNSVKYGALGSENGKVLVTVNSEEGTWKRLTWKETGGQAKVEPTGEGFGFLLLTSILPNELNATATMTFENGGLRYELVR